MKCNLKAVLSCWTWWTCGGTMASPCIEHLVLSLNKLPVLFNLRKGDIFTLKVCFLKFFSRHIKFVKSNPNYSTICGACMSQQHCRRWLWRWNWRILDYSRKCQVLTKFSFVGVGVGWVIRDSRLLNTQSAKFWPNFPFVGGGDILGQPRIGVIGKKNPKFWKPNLLLHSR